MPGCSSEICGAAGGATIGAVVAGGAVGVVELPLPIVAPMAAPGAALSAALSAGLSELAGLASLLQATAEAMASTMARVETVVLRMVGLYERAASGVQPLVMICRAAGTADSVEAKLKLAVTAFAFTSSSAVS